MAVILFCLSAGSCSLIEHSFVVICPPAHPNLPNQSWIIEYPGTIIDGLPVYTTELVDGEATVLITRGVNLPVFARPLFASDWAGGYPAAAVYPSAVKAGRLELNWEDGFACEILRCCLLNSDVIRGFDASRFCEAVTERAAELMDDDGLPLPGGSWLLDPIPITARLGYGLFRESSITAAETMDFSIPVSAGLWLSDNPLYPPIEVEVPEGETSPLLYVIVPINRRTVFIHEDSDEIIEVFFDDSRWCWTNLLTGASESGKR